MNNDLNKLKKESVSFHSSADGLWDIGLGACFILAGISFLFDIVAYAGVFYFLIFLMIKGLKNKITYTRIGYVNYKGMKAKMNKIIIILLALGTMFMLLGVFVYFKITTGEVDNRIVSFVVNNASIILGSVIALIVFSVGKSIGLKRFTFFSLLILTSFVAIKIIDWVYILPTSLIFCGITILIIGSVMLLKFISKYPKLEEGDTNEHKKRV